MFRALNFLSSGIAFGLTAAPPPSLALKVGLGSISGFFIPGLTQLWPDTSEVSRNNLLSLLMKPYEEIPYGGDIERVLLFPRGQLSGVLPDHVLKISGIDTSYFNISVGVVTKVQSTQGTPPANTATPAAVGVTVRAGLSFPGEAKNDKLRLTGSP